MAIVRVSRTIVYTGDSEWVEKVLAQSLKVGQPMICGVIPSEAASAPNPGIVHRTVLVQSAEDEVLYEGSPQIGQELPYGT